MAAPPPIFIGGAGRSGTTLLRVILDSHPRIACGPELKVTPHVAQLWYQLLSRHRPSLPHLGITEEHFSRAFANLLAELLEPYRLAQGKARVAEKTPGNVLFFQHLHYLFPESPLIHVIRDVRDVVCSLLGMDWVDPATGQRLEYTTDVVAAARYWVDTVEAGRSTAEHPTASERYHEVRYEDLVAEPERTLRRLFEFVGEPFDPCVLEFHRRERELASESSAARVKRPIDRDSLGRWRTELDGAEAQRVMDVAGPLLEEMGYLGPRQPHPRTSNTAAPVPDLPAADRGRRGESRG